MLTAGERITLGGLYRQGRALLSPITDNAANEAYDLLELVCGISREQLLGAGGDSPAELAAAERYLELLERRRSGEPLQYLLGFWEFMGIRLLVGTGVLIPRPETEELVEYTLTRLQGIPAPMVLDLCSGSGCIPIAIGVARPDARLWGVELSTDAYRYFQKNCTAANTKNVTPLRGDVFALPREITGRRYHAITANPPYIAAGELATLQTEVRQEPVMALDGGSDGLDFYRRLPGLAAQLLLPGGVLVLEIGNEQGAAVEGLVRQAEFSEVTVLRDLSGNDRIVSGRLR